MKNKWQRMSKCCLIGLLFGNLILMISEILMILGVIDDAVDEWILAGIIFLNLCGIFIIIFPARISHCRICQELQDVMEEKVKEEEIDISRLKQYILISLSGLKKSRYHFFEKDVNNIFDDALL